MALRRAPWLSTLEHFDATKRQGIPQNVAWRLVSLLFGCLYDADIGLIYGLWYFWWFLSWYMGLTETRVTQNHMVNYIFTYRMAIWMIYHIFTHTHMAMIVSHLFMIYIEFMYGSTYSVSWCFNEDLTVFNRFIWKFQSHGDTPIAGWFISWNIWK